MSEPQAALAYDLGELSVEERERRSSLTSSISGQFREVQELLDGYAGCPDPDSAIVRDALDWLCLERRCCPFLRLELPFELSNGPVWFRFRGGPGVKEFLAAPVSKRLLSRISRDVPDKTLSATLPPNHAVERTAGSRALAAAAHRER